MVDFQSFFTLQVLKLSGAKRGSALCRIGADEREKKVLANWLRRFFLDLNVFVVVRRPVVDDVRTQIFDVLAGRLELRRVHLVEML
jgi:hypothetical protein